MPVIFLNAETRPEFMARIERLRADSPRQFGTMDTTKMLRHMRNAFETAMGETDLPDQSVPVVRSLMYFAITHVMTTWPGGKIKAPDFWSPPAEHDFEEERRLCVEAMERFIQALENTPDKFGTHPLLGPMPLKRWSRLNGIHFHHHLRQFAV